MAEIDENSLRNNNCSSTNAKPHKVRTEANFDRYSATAHLSAAHNLQN
jgi:hypothetical protein